MKRIVPIVTLLGLVLAVLATPAIASSNSLDVERRGSCSKTSHWELDLERVGGRIEVDFEVRTNTAGRRWHVVMRQDGNVFVDVRRTTDHEGDFDVERRVADHSGTDHFSAIARNRATGERCFATASI